MREDFEKLAVAGKIQPRQIDVLVRLVDGGFCMHRSWGFGKVVSMDPVFARLVVDFAGKPGHQMDLSFAAESLKPIQRDHIYVRKNADIQSLRQMAALNHLDLIKLVLQSFGGRATMNQIEQTLVPDIIQSDWKKWWETAKREMKKDGHFLVPAKKTDPIVYQEKQTALHERLLCDFRAAKGLKARVAEAHNIHNSLADLENREAVVREVIDALNAEIATHQRTQPAVALEGIFIRDDLRRDAGLPAGENEVTESSLWASDVKVGTLLEQLPAAKQRRALQSFREHNPAIWDAALLEGINAVSSKLAAEFAHALIQGGKLDVFKQTLARLISQHQAGSELLLWLARERSDAFADILGPEVFRAMMTAMERDQFNEKRSNKLGDFVMNDQELLLDLIGSADLDVVRDLTRTLQLSPSFDDMDKRSLLARIVKAYPSMQSLISGEQVRQDNVLHVSWESLERRKNEYDELVQKKIPANSKEIAIARSYGDLSENHEYKAAKEMQKLLMRRKAELEADLGRARGTDFSGLRSDVVGMGTRVTVTEIQSGHQETYSILGAWDSEPEQHILSYLTSFAQSLMNKKPGDEADVESDGQKRRYRIDAIVPVRPAATAPSEEKPVSSVPAGTTESTAGM